MLAFMGVCVQKGLGFHWPGVDAGGFYFDATAPWYSAPTSAFATNAPGMAQILVFIGVVEGQSDSGPFWRVRSPQPKPTPRSNRRARDTHGWGHPCEPSVTIASRTRVPHRDAATRPLSTG